MKEKVIAVNRKANFDYEILERYEAGIILTGCEVKSLREGKVSIKESFAKVSNGEVWLYNLHISPYEKGGYAEQNPKRTRKLLLRKQEIKRLIGKTERQGLTLIPIRIYFKRGYAKLELGVARGKKIYDKRRIIKEREVRREIERGMRGRW